MDYKPLEFEEKWLNYWDESGLNRTLNSSDRPNYYVLEMFPYPSGRLHIGHVRNYSIGDCIARFMKMSGYNVLHPSGFDAFGLPAENAAIKHHINPAEWTLENVNFMIGQQKRLGLAYDWNRLVVTCNDDYYRWNQWIFLKMFDRGLVYRKKGWVNWDPVDHTVLANEQVIDGRGWRSGALVEKREIEQWYLKITDYADELLSGLDELDGWPERVKTMQRNWIGKSLGTEVVFKSTLPGIEVNVFTTRPDTLFGVTYVVLAPEHPLVSELGTDPDVVQYVQKSLAKSAIDRADMTQIKTGVPLGISVINPVNNDVVPVYVSDYVLMDYGTGAVMAVPAHDDRDFEFAQRFGLPVRVVIQSPDVWDGTSAYTGTGKLIESGKFSGLESETAKERISQWLEENNVGKSVAKYRLRDWLISRQRYWGTPIPMAYRSDGTPIPVPIEQLPVRLPLDVQFEGKGNPLEQSLSFRHVEINGELLSRETDTMDTFFDSSWYFLRYTDPSNTDSPFDKRMADSWLPIGQYIGGIEHAVLHLLYARFFSKVLRDLGLHSVGEPFKNLLCQGMVIKDGAKMSKSLGNVVDPSDIISKYGADTARVFILFGAPVERDLDWSDAGVDGAFRFLSRVFRVVSDVQAHHPSSSPELEKLLHKTIKSVTEDIQRFSFNTAISRLMELTNFTVQHGISSDSARILTVLIAPFAPFMAEELWQQLGDKGSVHTQSWPSFDVSKTIDESVTLVVQVNGKVRDKIEVPRGMSQADAEKLVAESDRIQKFVDGQSIVKIIFVKDKILNLVVK
ncbi:leucine--tRNA ligase [bacterium]|nr:leucine--tRNA ligase [bacterium]